MCSRSMIIFDVTFQDPAQMVLADHNLMVKTLASD